MTLKGVKTENKIWRHEQIIDILGIVDTTSWAQLIRLPLQVQARNHLFPGKRIHFVLVKGSV